MVNVLHTIDTTGPGGAETVFIELIKRIDSSKFNPIVLIRGHGWLYDSLVDIGVTPYIMDSKGSFNYKYIIKLIKFVKEHDIKLIQSHLFGSNIQSSIIGFLLQIPVISTFHGMVDVDNKERFIRIKCSLVNIGSRYIVVVSEHLKQSLIKAMPLNEQKLITIYNGIDTDKYTKQSDKSFRNELAIKDGATLIGAIGNIREAKGYDVLIEAANIIKEVTPDFLITIVGQHDKSGVLYKKLMKLVVENDLQKHIKFLGFRDDVDMIMSNLDIFVLSSTSEGFSLSTIQAMAIGVPIVVTKSGGPEEIVSENMGCLVQVNDPEALAHSILSSIGANQTTQIEEAKKSVLENYSIEKMIDSYEDKYLQLISL